MPVIAPFAFVVSSLVIYWVPWKDLVLTIPIVGVGLIWYVVTYFVQRHGLGEVVGGIWLLAYLVVMYGMSAIGEYGGLGLVPPPWGSIVVAVLAAGLYVWGARSGVQYMRSRPELVEQLRGEQLDVSQ